MEENKLTVDDLLHQSDIKELTDFILGLEDLTDMVVCYRTEHAYGWRTLTGSCFPTTIGLLHTAIREYNQVRDENKEECDDESR